MLIELKIPAVGESITEVQINEWLKAEGETLRRDEPLAVIDSEKTTFDLPAPEDGKLTKILHQAGDTVKVGEVIAHLEAGAVSKRPDKPEPDTATKAAEKPEGDRPRQDQLKAKARRSGGESHPLATEEQLVPPNLGSDRDAGGSEKRKRSKREAPDKETSEEKAPAIGSMRTPDALESEATPPAAKQTTPTSAPPAGEEVVPMSMLRRTIARRLVEARQTMAMLTTFNEVDMDVVQKLRQQHQEDFQKHHGVKFGLMPFFVKAVIDALKQFPQLNAAIQGNDIIYHKSFDLGVAVATDRGLVVPTLWQADLLSFAAIEKAIADFARRARENTLEPKDLEGGTFTITNGGIFGSLLSTPIINPPQSGILGLHSMEDRPVVRDGTVVIRPMMYLALTYDHRIVDGREAALFLRRIKDTIENPVRMLIEI